MQWELAGADVETGQPRTMVLDAPDSASATRRGGRRGLAVEHVRPLDNVPATDLAVADARGDDAPAGSDGDTVAFSYSGPTRRRRKRKASNPALWVAVAALVLAVAGGGSAWLKYHNGSEAADASVPAAVATKPLQPAGPVLASAAVAPDPPVRVAPSVRVTAETIVRAYAANAAAADATYKGREVAVTGTVESVGRSLFGTPAVVLSPPGDTTPASRVECSFGDAQASALAGHRPGDVLTVVGHCEGLDGRVELTGCRIEP